MPENCIITANRNFPIKPEHIDASQHLFNAFDHSETEVSAGWIIRFLQHRGQGWAPFTDKEINAFYARKYKHSFGFNRLVNPQMIPPSLIRAFEGYNDIPIPAGGGWLIKGDDGKYYITVDFVARCFKSRPAKQQRMTTA